MINKYSPIKNRALCLQNLYLFPIKIDNASKLVFLLIFITVLIIHLPSTCWSAEENLNEIYARKARQSAASWEKKWLEDNTNHYIWQPETLCYKSQTHNPYGSGQGSEIWRVAGGNNRSNIWYDISWPEVSANGKRISLRSQRDTDAFDYNYETTTDNSKLTRMIMRMDGSYLRPMPNAAAVVSDSSRGIAFHWNPAVPDVAYGFGTLWNDSGDMSQTILYKMFINDTNETTTEYLTFPEDCQLYKGISSDGKKVMVMSEGESTLYPATVYPEAKKGLDDPDGYPTDRSSHDEYWSSSANTLHDQYLTGADGDYWFYYMYGGAGAWWRGRLTGSASDGGPEHSADHTEPYDWAINGTVEYEPIDGGSKSPRPYCDGDCCANTDQNCSGYMSHHTPDRWGRYSIFSKSNGPYTPYATTGIYDVDNRTWNFTYPEGYDGFGSQHHDWHAFSDWSASSFFDSTAEGDPQLIGTQNYNDKNSQKELCYTHRKSEEDQSYEAVARPMQSPDGTKIFWHSWFLNSNATNAIDLFYVVAYYPYPPEITSCTASNGEININFGWRLNSDNPRGYTDRGWPDEEADNPPPPRETKQFRLWRSPDNSDWKSVGIVKANIFERFDFVNGGYKNNQNSSWQISDTPSSNGTWYYAVTAKEWSGLESRTLSNIWKVNFQEGVIANGNGHGEQEAAYPSDPGSISNFYTNSPPAPSNLSAKTTVTPGHYRLTWTEPPSRYTTIRYYNIYYSPTEAPPTIEQKNRIASVPAGTSTWLDWCADPNSQASYRITSVDTQGNEGTKPALESPKNIKKR